MIKFRPQIKEKRGLLIKHIRWWREIIVPGTWGHYAGTSKYTALKFYSFSSTGGNGAGSFVGDYIYLRNTEFYLTKAEALAKQNKNSEAQDVLFELNSVRDPSYVKSTNTGQDLS